MERTKGTDENDKVDKEKAQKQTYAKRHSLDLKLRRKRKIKRNLWKAGWLSGFIRNVPVVAFMAVNGN